MKKNITHITILFLSVLILMLFCNNNIYCQSSNEIDSLLKILRSNKADTLKIEALSLLFFNYEYSDTTKAHSFIEQEIILSKKQENNKWIANTYIQKAFFNEDKGEFIQAIEFHQKALNLYKENKYLKFKEKNKYLSSCYNNIALIYDKLGVYNEALNFFLLSLKIDETLRDSLGISISYSNIGMIQRKLKNLDSAIEYYFKSLKIAEKLNNKNRVAACYNNIGLAYHYKKEYKKAIEFIYKSLLIDNNSNEFDRLASCYNNLGNVYLELKEYDKCLPFYNKALNIRNKIGDKNGQSSVLGNIASLNNKIKKYKESINCSEKSILIAKEIGALPLQMSAYAILSETYDSLNNFKKAYEYHKLFKLLNDSIYTIENNLQIKGMEAKYENENKIKQIYFLVNQNKLKTLESLQNKEELDTHRVILYWLISVGFFIVILVIFGYIIIRNKEQRKRSKLEKELIQYMQKAVNQQMNPHFIFNTLNSIQYFLLNNDKVESSKYLSKFSQLMRITLDNSQSTLTHLITELEAIKLYIELEQVRYKNKFGFELYINPEIDLEAIFIPPLIIQPHIENAIWHGLMHIEDERKGYLKIQFNYIDSNVICIIEDNGIGRIRAEEIKKLYKPEHNSLGTKITKSRIEIINQMFNRKIEIEYIDLYSKEGKPEGTKVKITFPFFSKYNNELD